MSVAITINGKEHVIKWSRLFKQLLIVAAIGTGSWFTYDAHAQKSQVDYYRFKTDALISIVHQFMEITNNSNPIAFNSIVNRLNEIKKEATALGSPADNDRYARFIYALDSSVIIPDTSTPETP